MPLVPTHQDIGITLAKYDKEKELSGESAASEAYESIIEELNYRGWFERFPDLVADEVRIFFYVLYADNEINNGGFAQYFFNVNGIYAEDTVKAYKEVGAPKKSAILATVMASFPDVKYPQTVAEYNYLLENYEDELDFLDQDIETGYWNSGENIEELMISYVREHFEKYAP